MMSIPDNYGLSAGFGQEDKPDNDEPYLRGNKFTYMALIHIDGQEAGHGD